MIPIFLKRKMYLFTKDKIKNIFTVLTAIFLSNSFFLVYCSAHGLHYVDFMRVHSPLMSTLTTPSYILDRPTYLFVPVNSTAEL